MILFLMQRGTKTFQVILGGIFVASMESAATVKNSVTHLIYTLNYISVDKTKHYVSADEYFNILFYCSLFCTAKLIIYNGIIKIVFLGQSNSLNSFGSLD